MTTALKFSVVISTYNRQSLVMETISSAAGQRYSPHEIIVVVDGSQDNTATEIRQHYPDVIVYEQPNLGRSVARNTGIALATGDWVCFIDDDDLWHYQKLEMTARYIQENPDCQAVNNPVWFFTETPDGPQAAFGFTRDFIARDLQECHQAVAVGDISGNSVDYLLINGNSFRLLLERNRGVMSASVVRRDTLIRAGGFCPMQSYGEDWTMFVNVARFCEWHTLPQRLGFTRLHTAQSSNDVSNAVITLAGQVNAWYTGRPFPSRLPSSSVPEELAEYGPIYRQAVQTYFWGALRTKQFRIAGTIRQLGQLLLPKRSDWVYAMTPPQLTWRWERYRSGIHK